MAVLVDEMPVWLFLATLSVLLVGLARMAVLAGDHRRFAEWLGFMGGSRGQK